MAIFISSKRDFYATYSMYNVVVILPCKYGSTSLINTWAYHDLVTHIYPDRIDTDLQKVPGHSLAGLRHCADLQRHCANSHSRHVHPQPPATLPELLAQ